MWSRTGQFRQDLENNFIYLRLMNRNIFEKSNLRVQRNNTLNLECIKRRPWSVFRKPQFLHTFSVILILSNYRKCMGIPRFSEWTDHRLLCTPDLRYSFFELLSYSFQRESIKYMNSGRISWLPIQIFEFPAILPWLPMMQLWGWTLLLKSKGR